PTTAIPTLSLHDALPISHISPETRELEANRLAVSEAQRPFNLAQDLMVRALLIQLGPQEHILAVTVHHIATDAWSMGIFFRELADRKSTRLNSSHSQISY